MTIHRHIQHLRVLACSAAVIALAAGCRENRAAEADEGAAPAGGAITLWTDSTELFMEHPALIVGAPDKFAVHLTDLTDFAPLRSGRVTLRFDPQDGGEPGGISFLKEQQWKTPGFATAFATGGAVMESFQATGQIVPAAGKMARISAPVAGVVEVSGLTQSPAPGQQVRKGQTLAVLTPALGEGGSSFAQARAALREAEDEHARANRLYAAEAVPQRRVHEAEIRLAAAREALASLGGR